MNPYMKKILLLSLLVLSVVGLTGFIMPGILKDSPEKVVKKALTAYQKGDYVTYSKYLDPYSPLGQKINDVLEDFKNDPPEDPNASARNVWGEYKKDMVNSYDFEIIGSKTVSRDSAVVFVRYNHYDSGKKEDEEIGLRKIKGDWKISMQDPLESWEK